MFLLSVFGLRVLKFGFNGAILVFPFSDEHSHICKVSLQFRTDVRKLLREAKPLNWDDLKIILAICRAGTLSGAAKELGTSHSTVFRQITAIEKKLSTRFFNRLSHGYEMTEAGETVLARAAAIEESILDLETELTSKDLRLKGLVRLTAPEGISNYLLAPHLTDFHRQHPDIQIELIASSEELALMQHQADIAIRLTTKPPPTSVGRKVCDYRLGIYAAESYLDRVKGMKFQEYDYVLFDFSINPFFSPHWTAGEQPNIVFKSASIQVVTNVGCEGMGAVILPCLVGDKEPRLKRVIPPFDQTIELWLLTHADLRQTARVKALMDFLFERLRTEKAFIDGSL